MTFVVSISALPVADDNHQAVKITSNQLFHQLNEILKREIEKDTKNDTLEVGDKIKGDDGKLQLSIQSFTSSQGFPLFFNKKDKEILDDKEIIPIVNDFKGSSEYEIKKDSSEESKEEPAKTSIKKPKDDKIQTSTPKPLEEPSSTKKEKALETSTTPTSTEKHVKLLKDIAEEPVILTQH